MKNLKLLLLSALLFVGMTLQAQVSVNINIGSPPMWGPSGHSDVRYYYLPGVESYYDIQSGEFIYYEGSMWVHRSSLPHRYRNYDLYSGYKVVITDYHGDSPYHDHKNYKKKYNKSYRGNPQKNIGEKPGKGHSNGHHKKGNKGNKKKN